MKPDFLGMSILTFESRRQRDMVTLIERLNGVALSAPSMRELPAPESPTALTFAEELLAGRLDWVVLMTGVGAKTLVDILEPHHPREKVIDALRNVKIAARGPKPVAALREWGLKPDLTAPEPNTWRELLQTLEEGADLNGKRVAVQEYGQPNAPFSEALREHGADVSSVTVYNWALPEDCEPLRQAITQVVADDVHAVMFTSAQQVRNVLQVAAQLGLEKDFRNALRTSVIASIGPTCTEALHEEELGVDFEPDHVKMIDLVRGLARSCQILYERKRASHEAGVETPRMRRIDVVWPVKLDAEQPELWRQSAFMKACRREAAPYTPIWLMRQAGRYQRAYRDIRAKVSFLELCQTPQLAAEVTLMAVDQLGVDAAIIFADILLILDSYGAGLTFNKGDGPRLERPVREAADVDRLADFDPASCGYVYEAVRLTRRALKPDVPLIGFCGAPFTVAAYLIEGGSSRNFIHTKSLMYRSPQAFGRLLDKIARDSTVYLSRQIEAGAQVVQIFDSWIGCLNEVDYRGHVLPHLQTLVREIRAAHPDVPVIYFGTDTTALLPAVKEIGADVIGLDWRVDLARTWATLGNDVAVQGNFDPVALFATPQEIRRQAHAILDGVAGLPGHIFNLGHGILPQTSVDHALALIDAVHEYTPSPT